MSKLVSVCNGDKMKCFYVKIELPYGETKNVRFVTNSSINGIPVGKYGYNNLNDKLYRALMTEKRQIESGIISKEDAGQVRELDDFDNIRETDVFRGLERLRHDYTSLTDYVNSNELKASEFEVLETGECPENVENKSYEYIVYIPWHDAYYFNFTDEGTFASFDTGDVSANDLTYVGFEGHDVLNLTSPLLHSSR